MLKLEAASIAVDVWIRRGVKGFHDSTKGTYLLREFPLANKVPNRNFLTKNYNLYKVRNLII